jgi:hypothetical protein
MRAISQRELFPAATRNISAQRLERLSGPPIPNPIDDGLPGACYSCRLWVVNPAFEASVGTSTLPLRAVVRADIPVGSDGPILLQKDSAHPSAQD